MIRLFIFFLVSSIFIPSFSYAYLGPGLGFGVLALFYSIILAILAILFGLIYFPIKKILNRKKQKKTEKNKNKID